jgi:hypothetical protein
MKNRATRSNGKSFKLAAVIISVAPVIASAAPRPREYLRPLAKAMRDKGMAQMAVPRVEKVAAAPDQATVPDNSAASRAPIESVDPRPKPLSIWPRAKVLTVRFCRKSRPEILTAPIYSLKGKLELQQI